MSFRSGTQKYATQEQKIEQIEEMILLNEGITVEDPKRGILIDEFVSVSGGYNRNFALEKRLIDELGRVEQYKTKFKGIMNPNQIPLPSWWDAGKKRWREDYPNDVEALEYLERSRALEQARIDLMDYKCSSYPRDTSYCQNATQRKGVVNGMNRVIGLIQASIKEDEFKFPDILPEVFAEEDPSIYQSDEVVTVTPGALTWYYVKKPSGICERLNVSQNFVNRMTSQGWVFSLTDICKTDVKCPARVRIINNETNQASGDGFFNCDTIEQYTEDPRYRVEYYDGVIPTPTTTPTPTPTTVHVPPPEPEPEPEPEEPYVFTQCVDVYRVNHSDPYGHMMVWSKRETIDYQTLSDYVNVQNLLVRECGRDVPSDQEVLAYYGISQPTPTPPTTPTPTPPTTPTPTEPGQVNWIPEPFFSFINNVFRK